MQDESNSRSTSELTAWAAGLFEGEGSMAARKQLKGKSAVQLRLGMTDRDVVERFRDVIGAGSIYFQKGRKAHHKDLHTWVIYEAAQVVAIIERLMPWFGERRRERALEVLEMARQINPHFAKRTHCPQGHPYDEENTVYEWVGTGENRHPARRCKICRRIQSREKMRRRRGITPDRYRVTD